MAEKGWLLKTCFDPKSLGWDLNPSLSALGVGGMDKGGTKLLVKVIGRVIAGQLVVFSFSS